ncbi:hypothetical protein A606_01770 [Corynebacterium terpenotabidum Y-11]|uniref:Chemotaxis methyl-accepting receptor HlyB-like 4HB MCP domain-containing protein n=2 Tax=Corynebacterium terpenotabidum TaxID=89154 RepID=S4XC24_9CORY|nr:hypothetical protein A606_01770 [Corynebacterium terpenotabidum Y-11]
MDRDVLADTPGRLHVFTPLVEAPRRFLRFISTTPGLLTVVSIVLVAAILAAGGAMAATSGSRQGELNTMVNRSEPVSFAAQELYNSLSVANAVATTGFLSDSSRTADTRQQYREAVNTATSAVVRAANGTDDPSSREMTLILEIQEKLPFYISLVTEAGANNRQGYPLGAAYITQASTMMQDELLPAAAELHSRTSSSLADQQHRLTRPSWFALSGLVAAVIMLIIAQFWLAAWSNRRISAGYATATVLMAAALIWAGISAFTTWHEGPRGVVGTSQPLQTLTALRIEVQQARSTEVLGLVQRDYTADNQSDFSDRVASIDTQLEELREAAENQETRDQIDGARESLRSWDNSHAQMVSMVRQGDYTDAVQATVGDEDGGVSASFTSLDSDLEDLIDESREQLRDYLSDAGRAASQVNLLVLVLSLLSILCIIQGTRPRLQEYL